MFGFASTRHQNTNVISSKPVAAEWPPGTLVCKEDIYRESEGMPPILLLRKGYEVSPSELPRFIRNGARPHQFQFKATDNPENGLLSQPLTHLPSQAFLEQVSTGTFDNLLQAPPRHKLRVLILEPDAKSLKRLIDCLFICGVSLDGIHSVRLPEQLAWAIEKYRPHLLVVGYHLSSGQTGLELLTGFNSLYNVSRIIFTLEPDKVLGEVEKKAFESACPGPSIQLLKKPVSRFTVNRLLAE
jgi:hypothetical protein